MPFNTKGGVEVSLDVFGSWVTEMSPTDVPKGCSPSNQNVAYTPGSVATRPALSRVFSSPFPAGGPNQLVPSVTSGGSFVAPDGTTRNWYLDSNGNFYIEQPFTAPGEYSVLFTTTPNTYAKCI